MTTKKKWFLAYGIVVLFIVSPIISMLVGYLLALLFGCDTNNLNEGSAPDCPGGDMVGILLIAGWLMLFTFPFGGLALLILVAINLVWYFRRKKHTKKETTLP